MSTLSSQRYASTYVFMSNAPARKPSEEAKAIARELYQARGVPDVDGKPKGRGKISRDVLAMNSGVLPATLRWIEEAKSDNPDDRYLAWLYDHLPDANPDSTPHLALARARWTLDPRRDGLHKARDALAQVAHALLPPAATSGSADAASVAIERARGEAQEGAQQQSKSQPSLPQTPPGEDEAGEGG